MVEEVIAVGERPSKTKLIPSAIRHPISSHGTPHGRLYSPAEISRNHLGIKKRLSIIKLFETMFQGRSTEAFPVRSHLRSREERFFLNPSPHLVPKHGKSRSRCIRRTEYSVLHMAKKEERPLVEFLSLGAANSSAVVRESVQAHFPRLQVCQGAVLGLLHTSVCTVILLVRSCCAGRENPC